MEIRGEKIMDKEDLINIIYKHYDELNKMADDINNDIKYHTDLVILREKHNRYSGDVEKEIDKLKIKLETISKIIDNYKEVMRYEDIDIEDVKKAYNN